MTARQASAVIGALGAGRMGRGIAIAFAYAGHEVRLIDIKPREPAAAAALMRDARAEIDAILVALAGLGMFHDSQRPAILERIHFALRDQAPAALASIDVLFEGVPEVMEIKRDAFEFAATHLRPDAILASTTSTFLVNELAKIVGEPERFLNAHWLNPAYIVPLVELSPHAGTSLAVTARLKRILEAIGKVPVVCAATAGFIVPRLQTLIMNEAARMVEQGVATAEEIDKATRFGLGFRFANIGVVEFIDFGGNDILYYASRYLATALDDPRYAAPEIVNRHMLDDHNGLRDGTGFYDFSGIDLNQYKKEVLGRMLGMLKHLDLMRPPGIAESDAG